MRSTSIEAEPYFSKKKLFFSISRSGVIINVTFWKVHDLECKTYELKNITRSDEYSLPFPERSPLVSFRIACKMVSNNMQINFPN